MLTDAEYRHIIANKNALQGKIEAAERDKAEYDRLKENAEALKETLEEEHSVYNGFLGDAIEEYEEAHPEA